MTRALAAPMAVCVMALLALLLHGAGAQNDTTPAANVSSRPEVGQEVLAERPAGQLRFRYNTSRLVAPLFPGTVGSTVPGAGAGLRTVNVAVELLSASGLDTFGIVNSTIFAPSDSAFRQLLGSLSPAPPGAGNLANLTVPFLSSTLVNTSLNVLRYHVVPERALRVADLPRGISILSTLLPGNSMTVVKGGAGNGTIVGIIGSGNGGAASIIQSDIPFGSGNIVHIISGVLIPANL